MEKFNYKKKYGQNFIKNENLLRKILSFIHIAPEDLVIEIGMGQGDLTKILVENNPFYLGYEIDVELKKYLEKYDNDKTIVIFDDFLKTDIISQIKTIQYNNLFIIANLPYYITTPIINKIISSNINPVKMLLMVQKEVADRFTANIKNKEYGSLTVHLSYYFDIKKVLHVDRNNFIPVPNVDSEILLFEKKVIEKKVIDEKHFEKLLKNSFQFKRKTIKNNLFDYNLITVEKVLKSNNLTLIARAEEIPLNVFIDLSNELVKDMSGSLTWFF